MTLGEEVFTLTFPDLNFSDCRHGTGGVNYSLP